MSESQDKVKEPKVKEPEKVTDPGEEYLDVFIPKDLRIQGDDTIHLSVNGEECHIKPGNEVRIKRKFYEVYQHSVKSDTNAQRYVEYVNGNNLA